MIYGTFPALIFGIHGLDQSDSKGCFLGPKVPFWSHHFGGSPESQFWGSFESFFICVSEVPRRDAAFFAYGWKLPAYS